MDDMQPTLFETSWGTKRWWLNGKLHRTDGPAVEWANGDVSWFLNSRKLTFDAWLEQTPGLTGEVMYKLQYG
jgi:hypothetical protein